LTKLLKERLKNFEEEITPTRSQKHSIGARGKKKREGKKKKLLRNNWKGKRKAKGRWLDEVLPAKGDP